MSTTRRPEDVTDEEVERAVKALSTSLRGYHTFTLDDFRKAIASGLLVPPPRERTQMELDEEEWQRMRSAEGPWTWREAANLSDILSRLFPAAKAAGVTY